jgi:hypothetical protein
MAFRDRIQRLLRPETDEECIERARKYVRTAVKWGRWAGVFYSIGGLVMIGIAAAFCLLLIQASRRLGNMPNPAAPQPPNLMWDGFVVGVILGFTAAAIAFKGGMYVMHGFQLFHGERSYELLVRYHDGLTTLVQNELEGSSSAIAWQQPQDER